MRTQTLRGYVWVFSIYLILAVQQIANRGAAIRSPHLERSFFNALFPGVIAPGLVMIMMLGLLAEFRNTFTRLVLILSAAGFACSAVFSLYTYEYISFKIPHWMSWLSWCLATVLLGYRTNQLLKQHNTEIESN
jgi:membrane protein DedA with SNARE-associated domain